MEEQSFVLDLPMNEPATNHRIGTSSTRAHHGEIFQGVVVEPNGRLQRGLISLMCETLCSEASFFPNDSNTVRVTPSWKVKARRAAEVTLEFGRARCKGGHLEVQSNVPPGWGFGSSTSDVTAAIGAVAATLGVKIPADVVAQLAVEAETASDSLMFADRVVLFAHREGVIIEDFGGTLPALEIVGFNTDPEGRGIDTLSVVPAHYSWWEIEAFRPLLGLMRKAINAQDPYLVGRVASASARINQRYLPKPHFDRLEKLSEETGALGVQVAHSGTVMGLLFNPREEDLAQRVEYAKAILAEIGFASTWNFRTDSGHFASSRRNGRDLFALR
jgi:uncharacterized protein involved in propanediol utilization